MWQYNYNSSPYTNELYHYGVKGMKWHKHLKAAVDKRDEKIETARDRQSSAEYMQRVYTRSKNVNIKNAVNSGNTSPTSVYVHEATYYQKKANEAGARAKKYSRVASRKTSSEIKASAKSILSKLKKK